MDENKAIADEDPSKGDGSTHRIRLHGPWHCVHHSEESRLIRKFHWPTGLLPNDQISICVKVPRSIQVLGGLVDSIPIDLPESGECFRTQSLSIMNDHSQTGLHHFELRIVRSEKAESPIAGAIRPSEDSEWLHDAWIEIASSQAR